MVEGNSQLRKDIVRFCFQNLKTYLETEKMTPPPSEWDQMKYPLFVTWHKNGSLRGCIGTFAETEPLGQTLMKYSLIAAVRDTRFPPINISELSSLDVEVSLLSSFEKIDDPLDWNVGTHGIEIEFTDPEQHRTYRGTFLPNVAPEQGWDQETTLEHLVAKGGYQGGFKSVRECFKLIRRYQSLKFGMKYEEFLDL